MTIAETLLAWYRAHGRDLPWRHTRNPYHILVSEVMLQQTQVDRVKPFYRAWLKQFPTWKACALASNADVIHAWAGLGYNRRALMVRDVARHITQHGVPASESDWRAIKGIGPYTASAVSAFAQKKRTLPIDTNIRRVLGRVLLGKPFSDVRDDEQLAPLADTFLPKRGAYYDVPQAIFDLAGMICTKTPDCAHCPLKQSCLARAQFESGSVIIPKRSIAIAKERHHRDKPHPDRIYRGRILKLVREEKKVSLDTIGPQIDTSYKSQLDKLWIEAMIDRLIKDGLLSKKSNTVKLSIH